MFFEIQEKIQTYRLGFDNPLELPDTCEIYAIADISIRTDETGYYKGKPNIESCSLKIVQHYDEKSKEWIDFSPIDQLRDQIKDMVIDSVLFGNHERP